MTACYEVDDIVKSVLREYVKTYFIVVLGQDLRLKNNKY